MNRFKILLASMIVLFAFSCGNDTKNEKSTENKTHAKDELVASTENNEHETVVKKEVVTASSSEAFSYLKKLNIGSAIQIKYKSDITTVYNKSRGELDKSDPLYTSGEMEMEEIVAIKTKISPSGDDYFVVFSSGPSDDPTFIFYKDGNFNQASFAISALKIAIPGNGSIYSSGHTNNVFNTRKKFKVVDNKLKEIEQAFYYVGLKTKTLKPITLYNSEQLNSKIASLPKNYKVEVLLNKNKSSLFLIKTEFGLTGWVKLENQMYGNNAIDKLFYAGD